MIIEYTTPLLLDVSAIVIVLSSVFVWRYRSGKRVVATNWPVVGMFPALMLNTSRINQFLTKCLKQGGGTFELKGPSWFADVDFLLTSDPANVHYVLSKNFSNFSKGPHFKEFFYDVLGEGIFNAVSQSWEDQRKTAMSVLNHHKFQKFVVKTSWEKVETGLIPILDHVLGNNSITDLQDLFKRFTFDTTSILVLGYDPASLSVDLPDTPCLDAFTDTEEAIYYRHVLPEFFWKFQRWLQVGREKKLRKGKEALDNFLAECISLKKRQQQPQCLESADMLTSYMMSGASATERLLMDTLLNMLFAGTDTISSALTWFFYLLAVNPTEEMKIRREINETINNKDELKTVLLSSTSSSDKVLTYLHGALCESLRLFPPVPLQHKSPINADTLPSGHRVDKNSKTLLCFYSMGRMESIWGNDCLEFKPERWMVGRGVKHEPSFKFPAFNAGPRSCVGKETSFLQLKIVVATLLYRYKFSLLKHHHPVLPSESVILHMKHGLKVTVTPASN